MSNLDTALSLARAGWYVFPLTPSGKFLKGFSWDRGASKSQAQIREWWAEDSERRIGVHCGRSGLVVVDLDRKHGKDGFKSLKAAGLRLPRTFNYTSRSGNGEHHIFTAPEGEQLTIDRDLNGMPGVDIRSGIGMVAYNGPKLTKKPRLAPAPEWALVHKKDGWDYDEADLNAWLSADGSTDDPKQQARAAKARRLATVFPEDDVTEPELLKWITPLVSGLTWGSGRRVAYEVARARYTNDYPDPKYLIAFDRAWAKAITRVEADKEKKAKSGNVSTNGELFSKSPILSHIRQWADAQEAMPEAALAVVLARLSSNISPRVVLPRVGSLPYASLNLFVGLSGKSGHGKNGLIDGVDDLMPRPLEDPVEKVDGAATGEGFITVFVDRIKDKETGGWKTVQKTSRAFVALDEIGTLEAVADRSGNTLLPMLRSLWSGTGVSTPTADPTRQRKLSAHSYRLSLVVGVQPGLGKSLFNQDANLSGTTQRFLFAKVANPLPDDAPYVDDPGVLEFHVHKSIPYDPAFDDGGKEHTEPRHVLPVHEDITAFIRLNLRRNKHENSKALDGHWVQVRLRVAALLAILHGRPGVDMETWEWADMMMQHSNQARQELMDAIAEANAKHDQARGRADATRAQADEALRIVHVQERILKAIKTGKHSRADIRSPLSGPQRDVLDAALYDLVERGVIVRIQSRGRGTDAIRYTTP